jgi:L-threonylcarbamoyladenylate synthase
VTFVLKKKPNVPNALTLGLETIGVRVPHSPVSVMLSRMLESPITSTSANISGDQVGTTIDEIIRQFQTSEFMPDCFLDGGELEDSMPSTIVDLTGPHPKVVRKGPVAFS